MSGVGLTIGESADLISNLFIETLFGSAELVALITLAIVFFWIVTKGGANVSTVVLLGLSTLLIFFGGVEFWTNTGGYLPEYVSAIVIATIIGFTMIAFMRYFKK